MTHDPEADGSLGPERRYALRRWGPWLLETGFHVPEGSYLRRLFTRPRHRYLTDT